MTISPQSIASFLKWQLVPVRHLGRLRYLRPHHLTPNRTPQTKVSRDVESSGHSEGPCYQGDALLRLQETFVPRAPALPPEGLKAPFVNLARADDMTPDNPLIQLAFSREILDVAVDYFSGRLFLDSLQVLYSFPQTGPLKESQKWHLDYGDSRSLHCVMYLNDVLEDGAGPFVFIDKQASRKVGRGLVVRRIKDDQLAKESGQAPLQVVYGKAGSSLWVDPAACYHYGSRCAVPRTAIFVTFNSDSPFMSPVPLITQNAHAIAEAGKLVRPDLDPALFDRMLRL